MISHYELMDMESRKRASCINSLAGLRTAVLIGTQSDSGQENLAVFNSLCHIGANPPLFGLIFRPDSVPRHTYHNIIQTHHYTINFMGAQYAQAVHQTSAKYPVEMSEFTACGFTPEYLHSWSAPSVREATIRVGMRCVQTLRIEMNQTNLLLGSVEWIDMNPSFLRDDGTIDWEKVNPLVSGGLDAYFSVHETGRFPYAIP